MVVVGTSRGTPVFAVEAICQWWRLEGFGVTPQPPVAYPGRQWRQQRCALSRLEARPAGKTGGCLWAGRHGLSLSERRLQMESIEHRLFGEISKHWSGQPLNDYETIVRLIRGTVTQTGLLVDCTLNTTNYQTGHRMANQQMKELDLLQRPSYQSGTTPSSPEQIGINSCTGPKLAFLEEKAPVNL